MMQDLFQRRHKGRHQCASQQLSPASSTPVLPAFGSASLPHRPRRADTAATMGCLPVLLLFPLGAGIGYLVAGELGMLWGAGIGVMLGLLLMGLLIRAMRQRR